MFYAEMSKSIRTFQVPAGKVILLQETSPKFIRPIFGHKPLIMKIQGTADAGILISNLMLEELIRSGSICGRNGWATFWVKDPSSD